MRPTLKDVAQRAGVSIKTVSNVINGYEFMRPETRDRVRQIIAELGYQPNPSARSLRSGRSGIVAMAVPDLDVPYFAELSRHVVAAGTRLGWTVLIDQTEGRPEAERIVAAGIRTPLIDGIIFSPAALSRADLDAYPKQTPMVLLGEWIFDGSVDHVVFDNVAAAREATLHLTSIGRRRIAAIGASTQDNPAAGRLREIGYRTALAEAGISPDPSMFVSVGAFRRTEGADAMARLLESGKVPDAVFCFNDLLALGALRTLLTRGVRVPEDVALIGIDDIEDGRFSTPTLSTIAPDKREIAELACSRLAARIAGEPAGPPQQIQAGYRLLARESTLGR